MGVNIRDLIRGPVDMEISYYRECPHVLLLNMEIVSSD